MPSSTNLQACEASAMPDGKNAIKLGNADPAQAFDPDNLGAPQKSCTHFDGP
jgi:hypothetical protein